MAHSRRARGTGSYDAILTDGKVAFYRWRLGVFDPMSGKTKYVALKAKTRARLNEKVDEWKKEHGDGEAAPVAGKRWLVRDWVEQWLSMAKPNLKPTTWRRYESTARNYILPKFGGQWLGKISSLELQNFFNALAADGIHTKSTVAKVREVFRICLNVAVKHSLIPKKPVLMTDSPKVQKPDLRILQEDEVSRLLSVAKSGEYLKYNERHKESDSREYSIMRNYLIVLLAVASGMRQGEILGLTWDCANGAEINVKHTLQNISKARVLVNPKTEKSARDVAIPVSVAAELRQWKKYQAAYARKYKGIFENEQNLVFTSVEGRPMIGTNFTNKVFHAMCEAAKIEPRPRFHDLRHFFASSALEKGVPIHAVSEQLGHVSAKMTLDQYAKALKKSKDLLQEMLDENPLFAN